MIGFAVWGDDLQCMRMSLSKLWVSQKFTPSKFITVKSHIVLGFCGFHGLASVPNGFLYT